MPWEPVVSVAVPPSRPPGPGSTRRRPAGPRASASSSRPCGMPGPSSRTVTSTASGERLEQHPRAGRRVRRGPRRCRGRPRPRPRSRRPPASPGARRPTVPATETPGRRSSADSSPTRSTTPAASGATASCWRISVRSACSCSPASRPSSAPSPPELGPAALHEGEHLEHPVVDGPGQPGALRRRRRGRARRAARAGRRPQQRVDHQADDRAADQEEEEVPVDRSRTGSAAVRKVGDATAGRPRPGRPSTRQWMAHANIAAITQKPGTVEW